jgi:hypothetical protein
VAKYEWQPGAPRPGDPASRGPRPSPRLTDIVWLTLTSALLVVTVFQVIRLVITVLTSPDVQVTGGGAFLGFLVTVVWFLTIYWVTAGAWRRSVWGCPFEHAEDAVWERRCRRHALVPSTDASLEDATSEDRRA